MTLVCHKKNANLPFTDTMNTIKMSLNVTKRGIPVLLSVVLPLHTYQVDALQSKLAMQIRPAFFLHIVLFSL